MGGIEAIVFDFDGTMFDKKHLVPRIIFSNLRYLRILGNERKARSAFHGRFFNSSADFYDAFFSDIAKRSGCKKDRVVFWYWNKYLPKMRKTLEKHYSVRPNLNQIIKSFHDNQTKIILYSDYEMNKEKMLAIGAELNSFDYLFCSAEFGGLKPCTEAFSLMMEKTGISADKTLFVGDSDICDRPCAEKLRIKYMHIENFLKEYQNLEF